MNDQLLEQIEREVLGWSGVGKQRDENGPAGLPVTAYGFGGREIGHVHYADAFLADFRFPREVRDELIQTGRTVPHPAFPDSQTDASYWMRGTDDVPGAIELFRMSYERAKEIAGRRGASLEKQERA